MTLWNSIAAGIADATGIVAELRHQGSVGGGCINQAQRIEYGDATYFVKLNTAGQLDMFAAEAEGLNELRRCDALRIPVPVCWGEAGQSAYLVMENLEFGGRGDASGLGHFRRRHQTGAGGRRGQRRTRKIGFANANRDHAPADR